MADSLKQNAPLRGRVPLFESRVSQVICSVRLAVRTLGFHPSNRVSITLPSTKQCQSGGTVYTGDLKSSAHKGLASSNLASGTINIIG